MAQAVPEHVRRWNRTARPYPRDAVLPDLFDAQVRRTPHAPALTAGGTTLTYRELSERAAALARPLHDDHGVDRGEPVCLLLDRSLESVVALWAVLKAGGAYVPLDPDQPTGRLQEMTDRTGAACLLTRDRWRDRLTASAVLAVDTQDAADTAGGTAGGAADAGRAAVAPPSRPVAVRATDPAYLMFTSGTTGRPKAVVVPHRGAVRLATSMDYADVGPDDVFLGTTNPAFDVSCFEIFGAHLNGAHLVLPDREVLLSPPDLARAITGTGATVMWLTAGLFHQMGFARPDMFGTLRYLLAGGDALNPECVRGILAADPPRHLLNGYGPSENSTFSTTHLVTALPDEARTVPIGRPIANSTCYVLRDDRSPCDPGEEGELYVGGDGVAIGYLGDEERTAESFLPDPFDRRRGARMYKTGDLGLWRSDGVLEFTGRVDRQVKIRGFRVEPEEVESAALAHPQVQEAKAVVDEDASEGRSIVLWAAPRGPAGRADRRLLAERLRGFLRDRLPAFMLPARLAVARRLPLGRTGKVDANAVKELSVEETGHQEAAEPPRGDTEQALARLWGELLGIDHVRRTDDFFALGGQSLQVVRLVPALRGALELHGLADRSLVRMVLNTPVLHELAARLDDVRQGRAATDDGDVDLRKEAVLDPAVRFEAPAEPEKTERPRTLLLTGATGFLGAFLTRRLIDATDLRIVCLVRAKDTEEGRHRVEAALRRYGIPTTGLDDRVTTLPSDLSAPRLGLTAERFARLAGEIDVILHNGAHVNFLYPYSQLAAANVASVRELLRLAGTERLKPVHHLSSVAVAAGLGKAGTRRLREDDPLGDPELLNQGYAETKWVAEHLLREAAARGLPVSVYRPSELMGTRVRGVQSTKTMMSALFKAVIENGVIPDVPLDLDLVPVDAAAEALVHLVLNEPPRGHAYHLVNPAPAPLSLLAERARAHGYGIRAAGHDEWLAETARHASAHPEAPISDYMPMFTERSERTGLSVFEASFTPNLPDLDRSNVTRALRGSGLTIPPVDADLIDLYLRYLQSIAFLPAPR